MTLSMREAMGMRDTYIPCLGKTYTFHAQDVYVLSSKRIRFHRKTYTFCPRNVYVSLVEGLRLALNRS